MAVLVFASGCGTPIDIPEAPGPPPPAPPSPPPPPPPRVLAPPVLVGIPTNLTVTSGDASVDVLWSLVNGAQAYRLDWMSDPELLAGAASGTVAHGPLKNGFRYVYTVSTGVQQTVLSAKPVDADPTAPSQVSISAGLRDTTLSWSAVTGAAAYRLYWSYLPNPTPATGTRIDIDASQTSYTHSGLDPGTHYYYAVTAILSDGTQGVLSAEMGAQPGQVPAIAATASDGHVDVILPNNVTGAIQVMSTQTFDVPFLPFPLQNGVPTPIHIEDGIKNGTRYSFRVRPVFAGGAGPSTPTVYATPRAPTPDVPERVTLTSGSRVNTLMWSAVPGETSYDVTWIGCDLLGQPASSTVTVTEPTTEGRWLFRHAGLYLSPTLESVCPPYAYLIRAASSSELTSAMEAESLNLQAVPPSVTNADSILVAGVKPSGSRIEVTDAGGAVIYTVPFDRETGWTASLPLVSDGTFVFHLVAIDDTGLTSTETTYQVTRDTISPTLDATKIAIDACDPVTASPRTVTLSGEKDPGSAVLRLLEPNEPDQQVAGATAGTTWSGTITVDTAQFELIAKDAAGNRSASVTITLPDNCP